MSTTMRVALAEAGVGVVPTRVPPRRARKAAASAMLAMGRHVLPERHVTDGGLERFEVEATMHAYRLLWEADGRSRLGVIHRTVDTSEGPVTIAWDLNDVDQREAFVRWAEQAYHVSACCESCAELARP